MRLITRLLLSSETLQGPALLAAHVVQHREKQQGLNHPGHDYAIYRLLVLGQIPAFLSFSLETQVPAPQTHPQLRKKH